MFKLLAKVNSLLESHLFTKWPQITVTGGATSCIMRSALSVVVTVTSAERTADIVECTINDSIYGSFSGIVTDRDALAGESLWVVHRSPLTESGTNRSLDCMVKGCVNDEFDVIHGVSELTEKVAEGDLLVFEGMGAIVSNATLEAIKFNCLTEPQIELHIHENKV